MCFVYIYWVVKKIANLYLHVFHNLTFLRITFHFVYFDIFAILRALKNLGHIFKFRIF